MNFHKLISIIGDRSDASQIMTIKIFFWLLSIEVFGLIIYFELIH